MYTWDDMEHTCKNCALRFGFTVCATTCPPRDEKGECLWFEPWYPFPREDEIDDVRSEK